MPARRVESRKLLVKWSAHSTTMPDAAETPPSAPSTGELIMRVQKAVFEALPSMPAERLVDLLEFIAR